MTEQALYKLRFPIGEFTLPESVSDELRATWVHSIEHFPMKLRTLVEGLSREEKSKTYRPDGWNVKQLVHHCADSHMNAYIRFKLTLTEESPVIRPYFEERWAELANGQEENLDDSLALIQALHAKWVRLIQSLTNSDLERCYIHPQYNKQFSLLEAIGAYAWHCDHHLAHIKLALA